MPKKQTATDNAAGLSPVTEIETNTKGKKLTAVQIKPLNNQYAKFYIRGISDLCLQRFSIKAQEQIRGAQEAGSAGKIKKQREPKDFEKLFQDAQYVHEDGWRGIHAAAFRCAAISACRTVGFKMTLAKLALFTMADGVDKFDGTPLVRITKGEPWMWVAHVVNDSGVADLRSRPRWTAGWEAVLTIRYDADIISQQDLANLIHRIGMQVGIGEGRPDSKDSAGLGLGLFEIISPEEASV